MKYKIYGFLLLFTALSLWSLARWTTVATANKLVVAPLNSTVATMPEWLQARLAAQMQLSPELGRSDFEFERVTPSQIPDSVRSQLSTNLQYFYQNYKASGVDLKENYTYSPPRPAVTRRNFEVLAGASAQLMLGANSNIQINDPRQESGARVQNNTATAVIGNNIVVAYNDIGVRNAAISASLDGGHTTISWWAKFWQWSSCRRARAVSLYWRCIVAQWSGGNFYHSIVGWFAMDATISSQFARSTRNSAR
jgi:hypothetical protein